jgi:uncharacterized membrane protein YbhN (UPF0104 family)
VAAWVAVGVGLFFALRGVSTGQLVHALRSARIGPLTGGALLLLVAGFVLRAGRFRAVLGETKVPLASIVATVLLSQAANNVLPLRAGELIKTRDFVAAGHPVSQVAIAQTAEKLVEFTTMTALCAPALVVQFGYRRPLLALIAFLVAAVPALAWIVRRFRIPAARIGSAFAWSLGADVVEIALVAVTLRSMGLAASLRTNLLVLGAVNLAIGVPTLPGQVGTLEAGATISLRMLGVTQESALAFALLYHFVQWVPVTLGGAAVWTCRAIARRAGARSPESRISSD